jgi:peptidoglycan/LPS O-acetylase OafA/YrhL
MQKTAPRRGVPEATPYARHIPVLDGVRGLAVIGVMGSHLFPAQPHSSFEVTLGHMLAFGAKGVDLFFVLSGLLITGILYDSLSDNSYFRKFYARRILRIFPLYYGILAVFATSCLAFHLNFHHELISLALYLQNSSLIARPIRDYFGPSALPLQHFWSLAVEEQFYLVWPVLVFLIRKCNHLLIFCGASLVFCPLLRIMLLSHGVGYFVIHTNTLCRADSLLAGAGLALLLRSAYHDWVLNASRWLFVAALTLAAIFEFIPYTGIIDTTSNLFIVQLGLGYSVSAFIFKTHIALALHLAHKGTVLSNPLLRSLGKYSYGLYVYHLILFTYLEGPLRHIFLENLNGSRGLTVLMTGLVVSMLSFIVAWGSYNLFEQRFLRLKCYFEYSKLQQSS